MHRRTEWFRLDRAALPLGVTDSEVVAPLDILPTRRGLKSRGGRGVTSAPRQALACARCRRRPGSVSAPLGCSQQCGRATDIRAWIDTCNADPKPFVWHKTAEDILARFAGYWRAVNTGNCHMHRFSRTAH